MDKELKAILKSSSLLLVDDDILARKKIAKLLDVYVNKIYEAPNGKSALEIYRKYKPSFVITDIEMPYMNGLEFVEILKKENKQIPVIIASAYSNKEYLLFSIKLCLNDYLIKPISHNELILALEKVAQALKFILLPFIIEISDGIFYKCSERSLCINSMVIKLTRYESDLLEFLILNRGTIVTKQMIEDKIYIFKEMSDSALRSIIYKLRKKLVKNVIVSINRIGYKINLPLNLITDETYSKVRENNKSWIINFKV